MEASESGQRGGRVLLIDDDPALGGYMTRVLRERGGFDVMHELDPVDALRRVETEQWDLLTSTARYWSRYGAGSHAEPFEVIRDRVGARPLRVGSERLAVTP
jgi:DNA-binding NarL/FixJ family response regulator